jgi:hypothetical protein
LNHKNLSVVLRLRGATKTIKFPITVERGQVRRFSHLTEPSYIETPHKHVLKASIKRKPSLIQIVELGKKQQ